MGHTLNILPATTLDYRRLAEKRLPRFLFDYIEGGANDEITLANNCLLYTSPSPRDRTRSRMPSSA